MFHFPTCKNKEFILIDKFSCFINADLHIFYMIIIKKQRILPSKSWGKFGFQLIGRIFGKHVYWRSLTLEKMRNHFGLQRQ